jgi:hypothetical protein
MHSTLGRGCYPAVQAWWTASQSGQNEKGRGLEPRSIEFRGQRGRPIFTGAAEPDGAAQVSELAALYDGLALRSDPDGRSFNVRANGGRHQGPF